MSSATSSRSNGRRRRNAGAYGFAPMLSRSVQDIRAQFPGLLDGAVMLDGAAGTLVPAAVIDAVSDAVRLSMANVHGEFAASRRSDQTVSEARAAIADLLGGEPAGVVLGPNMT